MTAQADKLAQVLRQVSEWASRSIGTYDGLSAVCT